MEWLPELNSASTKSLSNSGEAFFSLVESQFLA
jgi:hypothetical protein